MSELETKSELNDLNFTKLRAIIHKNTGITIGDSRKSMLVGRLRSRLRETNEPSFKAYISRVESDPEELQQLINKVTTNKTYFYRTPRIWEHFIDTATEAFLLKKSKRPMRVWSGASSTGEEAHTIGVLLEDVRARTQGFDYSILGTDVSSRVLEIAEAGAYSEAAIGELKKHKPLLFEKYIENAEAGTFTADKAIRSRIKFKMHNLQKRLMQSSKFDVIFLRNVLIYFTPEDQENILTHMNNALAPDGFLYIGESESLKRLNTDFEMVAPMVYQSSKGHSERPT